MSAAWAGASRNLRWERRGFTPRRSHMLPIVGVVALVVFSAGCLGSERAPDRLMDGSEAAALPVELEGIEDPAVLTKVRVVPPSARARRSRSASCLDERSWSVRPQGPSVERVGVASESVTFEEESRRAVFGCSNSPGPREENRRWCGGAYGQLYGGRLRDPRLDILCGTTDKPVGFVWVHPGPTARYVSVEQPGYVEVYEVASDLPVRVATVNGVEYERFRARFDLLEHDSHGELLREYELEAFVAG